MELGEATLPLSVWEIGSVSRESARMLNIFALHRNRAGAGGLCLASESDGPQLDSAKKSQSGSSESTRFDTRNLGCVRGKE